MSQARRFVLLKTSFGSLFLSLTTTNDFPESSTMWIPAFSFSYFFIFLFPLLFCARCNDDLLHFMTDTCLFLFYSTSSFCGLKGCLVEMWYPCARMIPYILTLPFSFFFSVSVCHTMFIILSLRGVVLLIILY